MTDPDEDQIPTTIQTTRKLVINGHTLIRLLRASGVDVPLNASIEWPVKDADGPAALVSYDVTTTETTPIRRVKPRQITKPA